MHHSDRENDIGLISMLARHAAPLQRGMYHRVTEKMILASFQCYFMSQEQPHLAELARPELQKILKQETNMNHKITKIEIS